MKQLTALAGILALGATALGQETPPRIATNLDLTKGVKAMVLTVNLTFAEGLHGYQNPPSDPFENPVTISISDKRFKIVKISYPKGVPFKQDDAEKGSLVYMGTVAIPVTIGVAKGAKVPASFTLPVKISYQQCSGSTCFPPTVTTLNIKVQTKI
jgi:DsbC/DsbD-like thiol-disulfide interchange protein